VQFSSHVNIKAFGHFWQDYLCYSQPQWPRGLRRMSAATCLLRLWLRITPAAWMFVCCECRVISGRGLCEELITRPKESYRMWCVVVCDPEISWMRRSCPTGDCRAKNKQLCYRLMLKSYEECGVKCVWCISWCVLFCTRLMLFRFYKNGSFLEQMNDYSCLKEVILSIFMYTPICVFLFMCIKSAFDVS
jgi:hypothetical protein